MKTLCMFNEEIDAARCFCCMSNIIPGCFFNFIDLYEEFVVGQLHIVNDCATMGFQCLVQGHAVYHCKPIKQVCDVFIFKFSLWLEEMIRMQGETETNINSSTVTYHFSPENR